MVTLGPYCISRVKVLRSVGGRGRGVKRGKGTGCLVSWGYRSTEVRARGWQTLTETGMTNLYCMHNTQDTF